eukprot:CAMPEP_0197234994 /NCGR_PEP_ID=MMETSP1429-20130617/2558_1 /TAXON_ID=49237 /ORGANISM="Chaetoceros  sp., Strain UNC1202" /LENGTH=340 /DNA_ID=CAMNT_0042693503 /DNA_START=65 /DNA_END=1087 /DNA_ORIENTATION=-
MPNISGLTAIRPTRTYEDFTADTHGAFLTQSFQARRKVSFEDHSLHYAHSQGNSTNLNNSHIVYDNIPVANPVRSATTFLKGFPPSRQNNSRSQTQQKRAATKRRHSLVFPRLSRSGCLRLLDNADTDSSSTTANVEVPMAAGKTNTNVPASVSAVSQDDDMSCQSSANAGVDVNSICPQQQTAPSMSSTTATATSSNSSPSTQATSPPDLNRISSLNSWGHFVDVVPEEELDPTFPIDKFHHRLSQGRTIMIQRGVGGGGRYRPYVYRHSKRSTPHKPRLFRCRSKSNALSSTLQVQVPIRRVPMSTTTTTRITGTPVPSLKSISTSEDISAAMNSISL